MENYIAVTFNTLMLLCAIILVLSLLVILVKNIKRDTYKDGFNEGFGAHKNYLHSSSWWFSEHPPTASLLRNIVEDGGDRYAIRETWRKALSDYNKENQPAQINTNTCTKASWYSSLNRAFNEKDKKHQEMFHDKND